MFGAWQAGAWRALASSFKPDLIVGCSVGCLNGYAIAAGWTSEELCGWWMRPEVPGFKQLPAIVRALTTERPLKTDFAVVITDAVRMKAQIVKSPDVRAEHLLASCAVPVAMWPQRIGGKWYADGGLLNPLPVWAAVELGATRIVGLNVLPEIPSKLLVPFVKAFRGIFGHSPEIPSNVLVTTLIPSTQLGSMRDALVWNASNSQRWIEEGYKEGCKAIARL